MYTSKYDPAICLKCTSCQCEESVLYFEVVEKDGSSESHSNETSSALASNYQTDAWI